jgi:hypothetical protein
MKKATRYFEQVPVSVAKKVAEREQVNTSNGDAPESAVQKPGGKTEPYSVQVNERVE